MLKNKYVKVDFFLKSKEHNLKRNIMWWSQYYLSDKHDYQDILFDLGSWDVIKEPKIKIQFD